MSTAGATDVNVEYAEDIPGPGEGPPGDERGERRRRRREPVEIEVEREITKRQIIQSISSIVVVILYMVFTLLRDRDAGVVVVDADEADDDWEEES